MFARSLLVLAATAADRLVVAPAAHTAPPAVSASGSAHWTIPLPNPFGVEVGNRTLPFNARKDGRRQRQRSLRVPPGRSEHGVRLQRGRGVPQHLRRESRRWAASPGEQRPHAAGGTFAWFQVFDNGEERPPRPTSPA